MPTMLNASKKQISGANFQFICLLELTNVFPKLILQKFEKIVRIAVFI